MTSPAPTSRALLTRMLANVEEMRRAIEAADAAGADVDSARARAALADLEQRVRTLLGDGGDRGDA